MPPQTHPPTDHDALPRMLSVPEGVHFADLKLARTDDGAIDLAWAPLKQVCKVSGISVVTLQTDPELLVAVLAGWCRIARMKGEAIDAIGATLADADAAGLDNTALAAAGIRFAPPPVVATANAGAYPSAVDALVAALGNTSWGAFLRTFPEPVRDIVVTTGGPLCHAIAELAPEVLQRPAVRVLLGGEMSGWACDGGRWLSLCSRLLPLAGSIAFVLCTRKKPTRTEFRPIQFFPAQRFVATAWADHLRDHDPLPDIVVLNSPDDFSGTFEVATSESFFRVARHAVLLWAFMSDPVAEIVCALLQARGYDVEGPVQMERTEGVALGIQDASSFLRVRATTQVLRELDDETRNRIDRTFSAYFAATGMYSTLQEEQEASSLFGRLATVSVGGDVVEDAAMFGIGAGIDCANGRLFELRTNARSDWSGKRVTPEVMQLCPVGGDVVPSRFEMMAWIADAFVFGMNREGLPESATASVKTAFRLRPTLSRDAGLAPVLALSVQLGRAGNPADDAYAHCRRLVLDWLGGKGFPIDPSAPSIGAELPDGEIAIETGEDRTWALRYDDRRTLDEGAFWRVEMILQDAAAPSLSLRLVQVRQREGAPLAVRGTPNIVRTIAGTVGLHGAGVALDGQAWRPADAAARERFVHLLESPERMQPIVAVAPPAGSADDEAIAALAARLTGVAWVVQVDEATSRAMQVRLGRSRATLDAAVRVYPAGFDRRTAPSQAPLWMLRDAGALASASDGVVEQACAMSLESVGPDRMPDFQTLRRRMADARVGAAQERLLDLASSVDAEREHGRHVQDELQAALATYRRQLDETEQALLRALEDIDALRAERNHARAEAAQWRDRLDASRRRAAGFPASGADDLAVEAYPDTWDELEDWVERQDGRLVVLPQAAKAARESVFIDIEFAYRVLELLARYYVPMRMRSADDAIAREAFENARDALGVEVSGVGEAIRDHRYRKAYQRPFEGRTITLDLHAKRGNAFDPGTLLRVYFWYDAENGRVVIGHLPTHLNSRAAH